MQASDFKEWDKTAARISKDRGMGKVADAPGKNASMMALFFEMAAIVLISACASSSYLV